MLRGYGASLLGLRRRLDPVEPASPPLVVGREAAGVIERVGPAVGSRLQPGMRVWLVSHPYAAGNLSEQVCVPAACVGVAPCTLPDEGGALYAGLTAAAALRGAGGGRHILLLGAGGVGLAALQLAAAAGAHVTVAAKSDQHDLLRELGASDVIDCYAPDYDERLASLPKFDAIIDCAGLGGWEAGNRRWRYSRYVTLTTPLLRWTDERGTLAGSLTSAAALAAQNVAAARAAVDPGCVPSVLWAFFSVNEADIERIRRLAEKGRLCLEEEEVWRCALAWAKQRAGVTQPTAHWTEEERARVCSHLAPLMQHVRQLLIDSQVFAEEVEPTGAVPMQLSLERYRRAALQPQRPDASAMPRLAVNMFAGSLILQQDKSAFQAILNNWCGTPKQTWRLVFRASTHGYSSQAFHTHCDNIAPLLVLVQLTRGEVIGGFTDTAFSGAGYAAGERAFLFALRDPPHASPKHALTKRAFAVCYHPDCGPIFGAGADLLISHNCNTNSESYSNLHSYGDHVTPASLAPEYNFTVRDYEVFTFK